MSIGRFKEEVKIINYPTQSPVSKPVLEGTGGVIDKLASFERVYVKWSLHALDLGFDHMMIGF